MMKNRCMGALSDIIGHENQSQHFTDRFLRGRIFKPHRAFSVHMVGPLVWNGLPLALRSLPMVFSKKFLQQLKTTLFVRAWAGSASEQSHFQRRYINVCNE